MGHGTQATTLDTLGIVLADLSDKLKNAPAILRAAVTRFDYVQNALIVGVLIALCAALLGVTLVLKRYSMIGDGLSHVAFGAITVAMILSVTPMYVSLPVTILVSILLMRGEEAKLKGDSAIAMLSVSSIAIGYLLLNLFSSKSKSSNLSGDVCSILFGSGQTSILTLQKSDILLCIILAIVVLLVYFFFFHKIFTVTFDEAFAKATGTHVEIYRLMMAVITAVVIVLSMQLVGALLISALIVFPALCAMRLFRSFKGVVIGATLISVCCAVVGILAAVVLSTPVGSTIVFADLIGFVICALIGAIKGGFQK